MDNKKEKVTAPFNALQVLNLKAWQKLNIFHEFTCCSHDGCNRLEQQGQGVLIPSEKGWVCPCGKYEQNWAHDFMANLDRESIVNSLKEKMKQLETAHHDRMMNAPDDLQKEALDDYINLLRNPINQISRQIRLICDYKMGEITGKGEQMTIEYFKSKVPSGQFHDGFGYYATAEQESDVMVLASDVYADMLRDDFTHVVWLYK